MKQFNFAEDVVSTEITVTDGFGDGGVGILQGSSFSSSSLSAAQKQYYYNLQYNSKDHISVSYGHIAGSGSTEQSATLEGTTKAVYGQFYNLLETDRTKLKEDLLIRKQVLKKPYHKLLCRTGYTKIRFP